MIKVLVNSYLNFAQNIAGGVYSKVLNHIKSSQGSDVTIKAFDLWNDKVRDYDIIHYFALKTEFFDQLIMSKRLGKKIVISSIVTIADGFKIKIKILLGKLLHLQTNENIKQQMLIMADAVITETELEKKFIINVYSISKDKVHVIPNGVSEEIIDGDPNLFKRKYGISQDFILQVGRFDPNKNQLSVIRAMKNSKIPIVFVGGPDSTNPEYYKMCLKEASENCYFTGWINHSDPLMASVYAAAKVLVLPSHHEIFGNAIFEGAMTGCNIVATNVLPLDEFGFSDHVFAVDSHSIDSIRTALLKAYAEPIDEVFVTFVRNKYSLSSIFAKHSSLYKRL